MNTSAGIPALISCVFSFLHAGLGHHHLATVEGRDLPLRIGRRVGSHLNKLAGICGVVFWLKAGKVMSTGRPRRTLSISVVGICTSIRNGSFFGTTSISGSTLRQHAADGMDAQADDDPL
jgi:hypothetical protein